jgi:predicted dehydrogenase
MSAVRKIHVALVGLRFGAEFIPIYLRHPNVKTLTICDTDPLVLAQWGDKYQVERRALALDEALSNPQIEAVHLVTPFTLHAAQSIAVLDSGRHCACTVPMGLSLDELRAVVAAKRRARRNFMMMETAVYTREFVYVRQLHERGEFGRISFVSGAHYQDMEGWPSYWRGLPPMYYMTHAVSPALALLGTRAIRVHCFGSGQLRAELRGDYDNPFPFETAIFKLENTDVTMQTNRFLSQTARAYTESFAIYGEQRSFEWQQIESESPVLFALQPLGEGRGRKVTVERVQPPDRQDLLPPEIARFTQRGVYDASNPHLSFLQGGGHGGSHPHLVHEFVSSIIEERRPAVDEIAAANWSAAGICAHQSAMQDGAAVEIPSFAR